MPVVHAATKHIMIVHVEPDKIGPQFGRDTLVPFANQHRADDATSTECLTPIK